MAVLLGARTVVGYAVKRIHNPDDLEDAVFVSLMLALAPLILMFPLIDEQGIEFAPAAVVWAGWAVVALHTLGRGRQRSEVSG